MIEKGGQGSLQDRRRQKPAACADLHERCYSTGKTMAEHGTRTMYVHYGCRCEACCKAEHAQYLKRKEAQQRNRTRSKWDGAERNEPPRKITQRAHNANRWKAFRDRQSTHTRPIAWREIAESYGMRCAICGCEVDPNDKWISDNGRQCYGRKYPTVDHIVPLRRGGADVLENVQLACKHCNSVKGAS